MQPGCRLIAITLLTEKQNTKIWDTANVMSTNIHMVMTRGGKTTTATAEAMTATAGTHMRVSKKRGCEVRLSEYARPQSF